MADRPTLLRQPPPDPTKAPIENVLEVTELAVLGPVSHGLHVLLKRDLILISSAEHIHQHSQALAPTWCSRHLWGKRDRHVPGGRPAHRPGGFRGA